MSKYTKRFDGRKMDELRPIQAKTGVISDADGSAFFQIGNTAAYAAVYGPHELHPKFLQDAKGGVLRCHYNMMPFSGMGDRVRPGPNRRSKEISLVTTSALTPVVDLTDFPNAVVDVFIELPQTDAGSRCAGICAASMALADAGIPMRDMISAVAVGLVDNQVVVDLDYHEEQPGDGMESVDLPVAMIPSTGEITLLQMDGIISPADLKRCVEFVKPACEKISEIQKQALLDRYKQLSDQATALAESLGVSESKEHQESD